MKQVTQVTIEKFRKDGTVMVTVKRGDQHNYFAPKDEKHFAPSPASLKRLERVLSENPQWEDIALGLLKPDPGWQNFYRSPYTKLSDQRKFIPDSDQGQVPADAETGD